jgi:hypothetical protein
MADFLSFAIYFMFTDYSHSGYFAVIVRTLGTGNVPEKQRSNVGIVR